MKQKLTIVCFECCLSKKVIALLAWPSTSDPFGPTRVLCHHCGEPMVFPGYRFKTPKKGDSKGWAAAHERWCEKRRERFARRARRA